MLTQAELAAQLGTQQQPANEREHGVKYLRPATQRALADALGVTADELLVALDESAALDNPEPTRLGCRPRLARTAGDVP